MDLLSRFFAYLRGLFRGREGTRSGGRIVVSPVRVDLQEWTGAGGPRPLTWKASHPRTRAIFKAELVCPQGHGISLRGHSIADDGAVSPSVVCMSPDCDFHEFIRLRSWTGGALD